MAIAIGGHVYYWYWPRFRVATPRSETPPWPAVMSEEFGSLELWIPYPHQNLGALSRTVDTSPALLEAIGRLLHMPNIRPPAFGPFVFPPASEVTVEVGSDGRAVHVAARLYPVIGWLARTAGWLAGNPWLKGGEVVVGELSVRIEWIDGVWSAYTTTEGVSDFEPVDPDSIPIPRKPVRQGDNGPATILGRASIASLRLDDRFDPFPSGIYRLERNDQGFHIVLGEIDSFAASRWVEGVENLERPVVVMANESGSGSREENVLILTGGSSAAVPEVPATVVLHSGDGPGWKLPGEGFLSFLGVDRYVLNQGHWRAKAIDQSTAQFGLALIPQIVGLQRDDHSRRLNLGAWIELEFTDDLVEDLRRATDGLPKVVR